MAQSSARSTELVEISIQSQLACGPEGDRANAQPGSRSGPGRSPRPITVCGIDQARATRRPPAGGESRLVSELLGLSPTAGRARRGPAGRARAAAWNWLADRDRAAQPAGVDVTSQTGTGIDPAEQFARSRSPTRPPAGSPVSTPLSVRPETSQESCSSGTFSKPRTVARRISAVDLADRLASRPGFGPEGESEFTRA